MNVPFDSDFPSIAETSLFPLYRLARLIWHGSDMIRCYSLSVCLSVFPIIQMSDKILLWFHQSASVQWVSPEDPLLLSPSLHSWHRHPSVPEWWTLNTGTEILFSNSKKHNVSEFHLIYHILTARFLSLKYFQFVSFKHFNY